jgi:hypothetical protein
MQQQHQLTSTEYILAGFFLMIASFPAVIQADMGAMTGSVMGDIQSHAQQYRDDNLVQRRARGLVNELCAALERDGKDVDCPDISDPHAVHAFIRSQTDDASAADDLHAAPLDTVVMPLLKDLSPSETSLLRRNQRIGQCDPTMNDIVPGFYELCQSGISRNGDKRLRQFLQLKDSDAPVNYHIRGLEQ